MRDAFREGRLPARRHARFERLQWWRLQRLVSIERLCEVRLLDGRYSGVEGVVLPAPLALDVLTAVPPISNARPSVVSSVLPWVMIARRRYDPEQRLDEDRLAEDDALVADDLSADVGAENRRTAFLGRNIEPHAERGGVGPVRSRHP